MHSHQWRYHRRDRRWKKRQARNCCKTDTLWGPGQIYFINCNDDMTTEETHLSNKYRTSVEFDVFAFTSFCHFAGLLFPWHISLRSVPPFLSNKNKCFLQSPRLSHIHIIAITSCSAIMWPNTCTFIQLISSTVAEFMNDTNGRSF